MIEQSQTARGLATGFTRKWVLGQFGFSVTLMAVEAISIVTVALLTGVGYHLVVYSDVGDVSSYGYVGALTALMFALPVIFRDEYKFQDFLEGKRAPSRTFMMWNYTFLCLAVVGFLTKTTGVFSRGWLIGFYALGLVAVMSLDAAVARILAAAIANGRVASRRLMLIGAEDEIKRMSEAVEGPRAGFRIVASASLPASDAADPEKIKSVLAEAIDKARALGVEDVVILTDWSRGELIQDLVESFTVLPVAIHLGASSVIGRFNDARVARFGHATALSLTAPPLGPLQVATKRIFDLVAASVAVILFAPVFLAIAAWIKWDSPGPVFFRQRRRGYNLQEFRIWKFRTMTTMDDGDVVKQATVGDARITRVGHVLRRLNLDELPQLFNVVTGEMSLVGPRPHAVAHDRLFETRIAKYRRRLNVYPGITGWAQVNGLRGPTETDGAMRARVEHDLYYIDNWSITFDIYVLLATVFSRKAFRNAH
jgi:Undecaprenyl-phosphate glucose phosphotransferase